MSGFAASEAASGAFGQVVHDLFRPGGVLARSPASGIDGDAQAAMAEAVAGAMVSNGVLVVEAGTGVGKTWAYLAPLLLAGQRAWISTATQALQEQLFQRDIPALSRALDLPVRAALLKGRSNYVCLQRLDMACAGAFSTGFVDPAWAVALERVRHWANRSVDGDLSELPGMGENSPLRPWISSTRENCLGEACPRFSACRVFRARQEAMKADWVVINHHLFLANQVDHGDDLPIFLPSVQSVVFDEAHRLVELGETQLGRSIGSEQLIELARELKSLGPLLAKGLQPWAHRALMLDLAMRAVSQALPSHHIGKAQTPWVKNVPMGVDAPVWRRLRMEVLNALDSALDSLRGVAGAAAPLAALAERAQRWRSDWIEVLQDRSESTVQLGQTVRWVEHWPDGAWRVMQSVANVAMAFQTAMRSAGPVQSWVFTSATLGTDERLSWFTEGLGLQSDPALRTLRITSPFDHAAQASLYIPDDLPEPIDERHSPALAAAVARWAEILGGRTLVLTTSLRACERIAAALVGQVPPAGHPASGARANLQILAQGQGSKRALLARFRAAEHSGVGAVMVASASFWEGVDLPGEALQLLVIDKLPFPSPGDPLTQARVLRAGAQGLDAFRTVYLQKAALALKQGAGRLIRRASDTGILVIADRRLLTQTYGPDLLCALPPMKRLVSEVDMRGTLTKIAENR